MKSIVNLLCLLFVSSCSLFAQDKVKELLKNPDIIWAAEIMSDLNPDKTKKENKEYKISCMSDFIKLSSSPINGSSDIFPMEEGEAHTLARKIFNADYLQKTKIYTKSDFSVEMTETEKKQMLSYIDTMEIMDPETKKPSKMVTIRAFDTKEILFYSVKQLVYYNKKDTMFQAMPIAIAPVIGVFNAKGERTGFTPIFWIKLEETNTSDLNNPDLNWIKRTAYACNLEGEMKVLKETQQLQPTKSEFFNAIIHNADKSLVYDCMETLGNAKLNPEQIKALRNSTDTIITFDPKSFEEKVSVVKNDPEKNWKEVRFVQDWIWDAKQQKLFIRFLGFAPIIARHDEKGYFLNSGPLFYRRVKGLK